jgi:hypothetical protein
MTGDLTASECRLLDALHDRTIPTAGLHGPTLATLITFGLVEVTWAKRARLTAAGWDMFAVVGVHRLHAP